MITVCEKDKCAGCMLCENSCPTEAITIHRTIKSFNAIINTEKCVNCNTCIKKCPQNNKSVFHEPIAWYQGWSLNLDIRSKSSSGGFATAIAKAFIENHGEVCACRFYDGKFQFSLYSHVDDLKEASGSKYVKSNPDGIYKVINRELSKGISVLFIGLPCQVAAVLNSISDKYKKQLYTIDLICHGTPSYELLNIYLQSKNISLDNLKAIQFRAKDTFGLMSGYKAIEPYYVDEYTYAFLNGLTYTENCYHCQYARQDRISDLTLGDSWGSELPKEEMNKGISLALCQTQKGRELLERSSLYLLPVDVEKAVASNKQLCAPSVRPPAREKFLSRIADGMSMKKALLLSEPSRSVKNFVKKYVLRRESGGCMSSVDYGRKSSDD